MQNGGVGPKRVPDAVSVRCRTTETPPHLRLRQCAVQAVPEQVAEQLQRFEDLQATVPPALTLQLQALSTRQEAVAADVDALRRWSGAHEAEWRNGEARRHNATLAACGELRSLNTHAADMDLSRALTKRLRPLCRTAPAAARDTGAPPVGALPGEHGVAFPGTCGDLFSLPAAALAALAEFYGEALWHGAPPVRERRAAFARFVGVL